MTTYGHNRGSALCGVVAFACQPAPIWAVPCSTCSALGYIPLKEIGPLLRGTAKNWHSDRAPRLGAALAYYMALSLAPIVVIVLSIAGFAFSSQTVQSGLIWQIQSMVGADGAKLIHTMMEGAHRPRHGFASAAVGLLTLFFGATAVVNELRDDLNTIWKVPVDATCSHARSLFNLVKEHVLSFVLVLAAGLCLLLSLVVNVWVSAAGRYLHSVPIPPRFIIRSAGWVLSFAVIAVLFALIFKLLPSVVLKWSDVALGAVLTSLLFSVGKFVLDAYLGGAGFTDTYGAAGSLVILLVWVYYSAQVFFLGAEFTRVYACRLGSMVSA
jgi:membrane protein